MGVEQLVLPTQCCSMVLELGHEILIAGQLGKEKTRRRIIQRFYWSARMWRSTAGDVVDTVVRCDCNKYPQAISLQRIGVETIAGELIKVFE
ncbi:hypothetical protein EMCRGX_G033508 [Ephydatia muelleri]